MLAESARFVNWVRRRNSQARTWRDYQYDLAQVAAVLGDRAAAAQPVLPLAFQNHFFVRVYA